MKKTDIMAGVTIFVGSMLVFGVQPMVGNTLLPFFGGTAAVWTVCLAAFQTLLLAGYFYAHLVAGEGARAAKARSAHIALLVASAAWTALVAWKFRAIVGWTGEAAYPALGALAAVAILVGVPYTLLSSNASLIQALASKRRGGEDRGVYKLYAVSNVGSFTGLLLYPLVIEPALGISAQWALFAAGIAVYALMAGVMMSGGDGDGRGGDNKRTTTSVALGTNHYALSTNLEWLGLSALSCFVLNGISAHLCNDVTPLPLLWAVMLAIYLMTWVFGFTDRGAKAGPITGLVTIALAIFAAYHVSKSAGTGYFIELGVGLALILSACWTIHARLFKRRPEAAALTRYYLMIALGGAIGGTAASLIMPAVANTVVEYPIALALALVPSAYEIFGALKALDKRLGGELKVPERMNLKYLAAAIAAFAAFAWFFGSIANGRVIVSKRNFYGTGRVLLQHMKVTGGEDYECHMFEHAGIQHGMQAVWTGFRDKPTMCFSPHAGGLAITKHPKYAAGEKMRVAVAGMGIATLATFAREGDTYRFYEINPQVEELASNTNLFWYLTDCKASDLKVVVDDARRALEKERAAGEEKWDVIIIDVFAGDSIPPHMSTKEAIELYLDRLAPGGILSFHLTNWHLALSPIVKAAAKEFNLHLQGFGCWPDKWSIGSYWTFLTREPIDLYIEGKHGRVDYSKIEDMPLMTDEKHSLMPYISLNPMPEFE